MATTGRTQAVTIRGFRGFARELRRVDKKASRRLSKRYRKISDTLADDAKDAMRANAKGRGGDLGAKGIKGSGRTSKGVVSLRGDRNPRVLGDEFGSRAFRQFRGWRGNQWTMARNRGRPVGYALHRTIWERHDWIVDQVGKAWEDTLKDVYRD